MGSELVEAGGARLWYEEAGDGPAVLLVHAGGTDSRIWDEQWEPLAASFRVIRFDLPGAGRSPFPERPYAPTEVLTGLLDALGVERAAVVGVSAGGGIAVDLAIERPERTWALVAVATGPRGQAEEPADPRALAFYEPLAAGDTDRAVAAFLELWAPLRTSPAVDGRIRRMVADNIGMLRTITEGRVALPEWSAADRLGEIRVPTLVVRGDRDILDVEIGSDALATGIPGARLAVLPDTDHLVPIRSPHPFTRTLLPFLESAQPASR